MSMTLASFGVVFLSFGGVILVIGFLGLQFGYRHSLGFPGMVGLVFVLIGAVLYGAGWAQGRRS
jgi:hypothetical protein